MQKKSVLIILFLTLFFCGTFKVNAKDLYSVEDKKVTITIDLTNEDKDLTTYQGVINYDSKFFYDLDETNFFTNNEKEVVYNKENKRFVLIDKNSDLKYLKITFYVRDEALDDFSFINIQNLIGSNGTKTVNLKDRNIELIKSKDEIQVLNILEKNSQIFYDDIYVGFNIYVIVLIVITFVLILSFSFFLFSNNSKISKLIVNGVLAVIIFLTCFGIYKIYSNRSDVNNDKKTNFDDSYDVIKYLIGLENIKSKSLSSYNSDVDNDGFITISDVASIANNDKYNIDKFEDYEQNIYKNIEVVNIDKAKKTFDVQIESIQEIKEVTINQNTYNVTKDDSLYYVTLDLPSLDRNTLTVNSLTLNDNKKIDVNKKFILFKNKPVLKNLEINLNKKINVSFDLDDKDNTVNELKAVLINQDGNIIETKNIKNNYKSFNFDTKIDDKNNYTISILASYNCNDGNIYKDEKLLSTETKNGKIMESSISNYYPEKNSDVTITYKIDDSNQDIKSLKINDKIYDVEKISSNTYKINYKVLNKVGINTIAVQQIIYENQKYTINYNTDKIDVLKDSLTVKDFSIVDDSKKETITVNFNILDNDKTFLDGNVCVDNDCKKITKTGKKSILFNVPKNKMLEVSININYALDSSNDTHNKHTYTDKRKYVLVDNYNLEISNLDTYKSNDEQSTTFDKEEKIIIKFNSKNITTLYPAKIELEDISNSLNNTYDVKTISKKDGTVDYYIELIAPNKKGTYEIKIKSITLNSGKKINVNEFKTKNLKNILYEVL